MNEEFYGALYNAVITRYLDKNYLEHINENKKMALNIRNFSKIGKLSYRRLKRC